LAGRINYKSVTKQHVPEDIYNWSVRFKVKLVFHEMFNKHVDLKSADYVLVSYALRGEFYVNLDKINQVPASSINLILLQLPI